MLKKLMYCGLMLTAGGAWGQACPVPGLQQYRSATLRPELLAGPAKRATEPRHLPGSRSLFEVRYPLAPSVAGAPLAGIQALPGNRLAYYQQGTTLATGAALAGAVAGWLLSADPRVQAYQQNRQFAGFDASSMYRHASADDLSR